MKAQLSMAKKSKKSADNTRPDILACRADESTYIAVTPKPNLAVRGSGIDLKRLSDSYGHEDVRPSTKKAK
jgi:hypothetical protein